MAKRRVPEGQENFPWARLAGPAGRKVPARERMVGDRPQTQIKLAAYQAEYQQGHDGLMHGVEKRHRPR